MEYGIRGVFWYLLLLGYAERAKTAGWLRESR